MIYEHIRMVEEEMWELSDAYVYSEDGEDEGPAVPCKESDCIITPRPHYSSATQRT